MDHEHEHEHEDEDEHEDDYVYEDFELAPPVQQQQEMDINTAVKRNILPFLPAKSLVRFSSVSKEWYEWMKGPYMAITQSSLFKNLSGFFFQQGENDPTFVSLNDSLYGVPMPSLAFLSGPVHIVSSCNGLLVCRSVTEELYYICNPATREWNELPRPQLHHNERSSLVLAFEPSAINCDGHYQLICAVPMQEDLIKFELYTSTTNSWTTLDTTVVDMPDQLIEHNTFYMNGVAYWLTNTKNVIAFDPNNNVHEVIPIPHTDNPDGILTQIRGELCYVSMSHSMGSEYYITINGGMDMSVTHRLKVSIEDAAGFIPEYKVLPCLDGEKVMILFEDCIHSYSIHDQILEEITHVGRNDLVFADKHLVYVNTLAQLPAEEPA